jgi:nucleotide-binding universal stress UspA family protein
MNEIVVGVDRSPASVQALVWASREAGLRDLPLRAVLVWHYLDQSHPGGEDRFDPLYDEHAARASLDEVIEGALGPEAAATVQREVVCDLAPRALLEQSSNAALLVLGSRGIGGFKGLLLGSVSHQCLKHATVPVAIIRAGWQPPSGDGPERIVVGVDGSAASHDALRWAVVEGRLRGATVEAVHAWHVPALIAQPFGVAVVDPRVFEEAAQRVVDAAVAEVGVPDVVPRLVQGDIAGSLLDVSRDADLVVTAKRGIGGFKGLLLGSVSDQVAQHATVPVVVIPES